MEIGLNQASDIARGFRISQDGIVLVTPSMLQALETRAQASSHPSPLFYITKPPIQFYLIGGL